MKVWIAVTETTYKPDYDTRKTISGVFASFGGCYDYMHEQALSCGSTLSSLNDDLSFYVYFNKNGVIIPSHRLSNDWYMYKHMTASEYELKP